MSAALLQVTTAQPIPGLNGPLGMVVRPLGSGRLGTLLVTEPVYSPQKVIKAYSDADQELLPDRSATPELRYGFSIMNSTDRVLYIRFGGAAAVADHAVAIQPSELYESQFRITDSVHGIGAAGGSGNIMIIEYGGIVVPAP